LNAWHVVYKLLYVVIDDFEQDTKGARCENSSLRRMKKSKCCLPKKDPKTRVLPPGAVACSLAPGHHQANPQDSENRPKGPWFKLNPSEKHSTHPHTHIYIYTIWLFNITIWKITIFNSKTIYFYGPLLP
jgi:hypothetical protein